MRYKVYSDSYLIFDSAREDLLLIAPQLELELNKTGSFSFIIYKTHPHYEHLEKLKSIITVYQDEELIFRGRILNDVQGWHNEKQVTCEGELAFLVDTIQRPYSYPNQISIETLFRRFMSDYNGDASESHRFTVGQITVPTQNVTANEVSYQTTWDAIQDKLITPFGGYLWVRHTAQGNYIDWLADFTAVSPQPVELGKNLLDISKKIAGEDIVTDIIPLGAKTNETPLTISSLTNEETGDIRKTADYVYSVSARERYGRIVKTETFDDVTSASELLAKAKEKLSSAIALDASIEITAADLAGVDADMTSFRLGTYIPVHTGYHGINDNFLIKKLSLSLTHPASNKLVVGKNYKTLTEQNANSAKTAETLQKELIAQQENIDKKIQLGTDRIYLGTGTNQITLKQNAEKLEFVELGQALYADGDTVEDEGTTGAWYWRKWASGRAECYGSFAVSEASTTAYGNLFRSAPFSPGEYPFEFTFAPWLIAFYRVTTGTGGTVISTGRSETPLTYCDDFIITTANAENTTGALCISVSGAWK